MGNDMDLFDVESIKEGIAEEENMSKDENLMPAYGSEDWNAYVMGKFESRELIDGNPVCAG